MQPATRDDLDSDWTGRIFVFWIGGAAISPARRGCLETLSAAECRIHLVTDETLASFVLPEAPLHPAYPLLSPIHRSDYLRDRKSTRLNSQSRENLVCRLLLEKKKIY